MDSNQTLDLVTAEERSDGADGATGCSVSAERPGVWAFAGLTMRAYRRTHACMEPALLAWATAIALLAFAAVAAIDGVYIHLWRLRLHARAESYREHLWHTASAVLTVPTVVLLFVVPASGVALWAGLGLLALTHAVEVLDVRAERTSRRSLGGLSRFELSLHIGAVAMRAAAVAGVLVAGPSALVSGIGLSFAIGAVAISALHIVLAVVHCPVCRRHGVVPA